MLRISFPDAHFIQAGENLGFARANNLGYTHSCGEYILFLNPDTEVVGDALSRMVAYLKEHPPAGAVGAFLLNSDGSMQTSCVQAFPTISNQVLDLDLLRRWFPSRKLWGMQALFDSEHAPTAVDAISGACFLVRRNVFEDVGQFSEQYFMYSDDLDLSYKIRQAGHPVICMSDCQVIHHGGKSSSRRSDCFADVLQRQSLYQLFRETRGPFYGGIYRVAMSMVALIRLAIAICILPVAGLGRQGERVAVLKKWTAILRWGLGLESWSHAMGSKLVTEHLATSVSMAVTNSTPAVECCSSTGQTSYALITPVRDEESFIGDMIESIGAQTVPPAKWVIVDDGSRDRTAEIVLSYIPRFSYIQLVRLPPRDERLAGGEGAIPNALRCVDISQYDFLARFDADLLFTQDYIANLLKEFSRDPKLGIAGGGLYIEKNGTFELERNPEHHVRGALKMYRRRCFEDVGGLTTEIGWDTIDEVRAWTNGWTTRSFNELRVIHRRPTGEGIAAWRVYRERGRGEYLTWSHPLFVLAKAVKTCLAERSLIKPLCYLTGFLTSCLRRESRMSDAAFTRARRGQQIGRLTALFRSNKHECSDIAVGASR
jgi:GT2 family glycosyltransferase